MDRYQPQLGELVRELRVERGFRNQDDLADAAGVDPRTLRLLEKGGRIQDAKLAAICSALDISLEEIKYKSIDRRIKLDSTEIQSEEGVADFEGSPFKTVVSRLDEVDRSISRAFGTLSAPSRADGVTEFSARRLVSSLSALGIPLEVTFSILSRLPDALTHYVPENTSLSTGHLRSAVAQLISELGAEELEATEVYQLRSELARLGGETTGSNVVVSIDEIKFDWASRYARRYGNPTQIMQVLEENGSTKRLDYGFIKGDLIPNALRRILGEDFSIDENQLVNPSVVSEMARTTLEEFRRLGLYTIRYRTALWLTEDLALHPPHPWVVSAESRKATIDYDFERAAANFQGMEDTRNRNEFSIRHRFSEIIHHLSSAILATYSGFLGHRQTSSLHILRHWLAIQDDNPVLWKNCDLRLIDSDLYACGLSRNDFSTLLKRIDISLHSRGTTTLDDLVKKCSELKNFASLLYKRRSTMIDLETSRNKGAEVEFAELAEIIKEVIFSCFGARRVVPIYREKDSRDIIGFSSTPQFEGTVLEGRPPLCLFLIFGGNENERKIEITCEMAVDKLNAHRLAETCLIICSGEPSGKFEKEIDKVEQSLPGKQILRVFGVDHLRMERKQLASIRDFIDSVFSG